MIRVVRVGGSLLTWDEFLPTFQDWMARQSEAVNILVVGGGPWVELLRQAARRFQIDDETAHWQCVKAMSVTASLLASLLHARIESQVANLCSDTSGPVVFDVSSYLRSNSQRNDASLPANWSVTSDSIAARIACTLAADELVLLKSRSLDSPHPEWSPSTLRDHGVVDTYFPTAAQGIHNIRYINLRLGER